MISGSGRIDSGLSWHVTATNQPEPKRGISTPFPGPTTAGHNGDLFFFEKRCNLKYFYQKRIKQLRHFGNDHDHQGNSGPQSKRYCP
jgi:hypothetical protein